MRSSTWRLEDLRNVILNLGFVGENLHTRQIFDCKKMFDQYPNASVSMTVTPPEGEPYPGTIERDGDLVIWDVRDSDLVAEGDGEIQLVFTQEPHIARSYNAQTHICRSQVPTGSIPSGLDDYITRADQLLDQVEDTFPAGGTTGQVLAKKSDTDYDTEWVDQGGGTEDYDELENRPQIGGVTLTGNKTLHDLGAASEADVEAKYTKPETGIPASDLAAGVIPDPEDLIDDEAGAGDTNKVWSADKSSSLLTQINSKMDAPETAGTSGQVLGLDSNLKPFWSDQSFAQSLSGWSNKGIAASNGAFSVNTKRIETAIPSSAIACYVDTGYSFIIYGWNGNTYMGWWTGVEWSKSSFTPKTEELDISEINNQYSLYVVVIHGVSSSSAVNISVSEGSHFHVKCKTDSQFITKYVPADGNAVGSKFRETKAYLSGDIRTITGNEVIHADTSGYITTNGNTVNVESVNASTSIFHGVYPCSGGDEFTVIGDNPGSVANYCVFVDSSFNVLSREEKHINYTVITAPADSAYIIFQRTESDTNMVLRGRWILMEVDKLKQDMQTVKQELNGYRSELFYESDDTQNVITSFSTLISMYDALVTGNPYYVTKNTLTHGTFTNYEYVFSMGNRNSEDGERTQDNEEEKPVILIMSGVHGHERCSITGLYLFAKALCESPELSPIRNGLTIKIIPVVSPSAYNNNSRVNGNGVNINRNFDANWVLTPNDGMNYSGASPADQDETQVVQDWMYENRNADLEIDWHNSAFENELTYIATCVSTGFAVDVKKGFFYGIDRIMGHWINDREIGDSETIFAYTGTECNAGTSNAYADKIGLKGCYVETAWEAEQYAKESVQSIGVNAEAFSAIIKGINKKYIDT